jgi:hypothetical protein
MDVTTVAELGGLTRFDNPRRLIKFLGLIPRNIPQGSDAGKVRSPQPAILMRIARSWKAPGGTAIPTKTAGISNLDWYNHPKPSRTSAGKPKSDFANATNA